MKELFVVERVTPSKVYPVKVHAVRSYAHNHIGQLKHKYPNRVYALRVEESSK